MNAKLQHMLMLEELDILRERGWNLMQSGIRTFKAGLKGWILSKTMLWYKLRKIP